MKRLVARPDPPTLHEAAEALADGGSALGICRQLLERYRAVDGVIKAFLKLDEPRVLEAAAQADARRQRDQALGPLDGLPVAIKDCISVAGESCGCASRILEGYVAPYDSTAVARLRAAGLIPYGRTNMDEFAMGSTTENSGYAPTCNPWDLDCVPGGSSGGSAAAVAAGEALAALGSDTGGSVRQPAGFCGVVGLKPTYGRVSRYGLVAYASSLDQIGTLTNDVQDAALLLDLIGGHDPRDCTSLPAPNGGFEQLVKERRGVKGLKVAVPKEYFAVEGLAADVRQATVSCMTALAEAGAEIDEVSLPHTAYVVASYYVIATAEASSNLARFEGIRYGARAKAATNLIDTYFKTRQAGFGQEVKRRIILGTYVLSSGYYDAYYLRAQKVRTLVRQDYTRIFADHDVILSPVAPTTANRRGEFSDPLQMYLSDIYTIPVNLAGICGITVPVAQGPTGLPIGVQLLGDALQEQKILPVAQWLMQEFAPQCHRPTLSSTSGSPR